MQENNIEKIIDETLQSFEGAKRAAPKPYLLTRLIASINKQSLEKNIWTRAGAFISKPSIAFAGIAFILLINMSIIFFNRSDTDKTAAGQNSTTIADEFAVNAANIYDIENQEAQ